MHRPFVVLALLVIASCAPSGPTGVGTTPIKYVDIIATQMSGHASGPAIVVGINGHGRATIVRLVPAVSAGKDEPGSDQANGVNVATPDPATEPVMVAVFQGQQTAGGFMIRVTSIERNGSVLVVHATFAAAVPGAVTTQESTSPAHVVSISPRDAAGLREVILLDQAGAERARASLD